MSMRRAMWLGSAMCAALMVGADAPEAAKTFVIPARIFPYGADWRPVAGQRAVVAFDGAPAATEPRAFDELAKSAAAGDRAGIEQVVGSGQASRIARGTPVLILRDLKPPPGPVQTMSSTDLHARAQAGVGAAPEPPYPVEVRFLAGKLAGQTRFMSRESLGEPFYQGAAKKPKGKGEPKPPAEPAGRAAILLRQAQNLEKSKKLAPALTYYRQVVKDFPDSPQATTAAERIKAMGGK